MLALVVARGASYLLTMNAVNTIISIVAFAFIARLLSQPEMGIMTTLILVLGFSEIIVSLGLPSAVTRFASESKGRTGSAGEAVAVARASLKITIAVSIVAGLAVVALATSLSWFATSTAANAGMFMMLGATVVAAGVGPVLSASLLGLQKLRALAVLGIVRFAMQQSLVVGLLLLGWGLSGVVIGWTVANLFYGIAAARLVLSCDSEPPVSEGVSLRDLLAFSWPLYAGQFITFAYGWFDRALLIGYVPLGELGVYNVAYTAFGVLAAIPGALATTLFPHYSEIVGRDGFESLKTAIFAASKYVSLACMPLAIGLAVTAGPALSLLAGRSYEIGAPVLAVLSLFAAVTLINSSLGSALIVIGKPKQASVATGLSVVASVLAAILLVPQLSLVGMAFARGVGMVVLTMITIRLVRNAIGLKVDFEALWKSAFAGLVMGVVVLGVETLVCSRYLLPLYVAVGAVTYLLMIRVLRAVRVYDIELVETFMGRRWTPVMNGLKKVLTP